MSIRNQIAWAVGIIGLISLAFGIMMISSFNHTGNLEDVRLGGWLLMLGLIGTLTAIASGDFSSRHDQSEDEESTGYQDEPS